METKSLPENKYLGVLCKRGHDWEGTGKSARKKRDHDCAKCAVERTQKYRKENKDYYKKDYQRRKEYNEKWWKNNDYALIRSKRLTENLDDLYIKRVIAQSSNLTTKDVPLELIEVKRLYLKIYREIKKQKGGC